MWFGIALSCFYAPFVTLEQSVIGAMAGYLSLWTVYQLFKLATGKEGMGFGDFKLLAAVGALLGWSILPVTIMLSAVAGSVIGITLSIMKSKSLSKPIPFGPYIAIAGWLAMMAGSEINAWYLGLFVI